jgi:serine/threonine protein kinase
MCAVPAPDLILGIIHGDIKPNNILITNDEIGQPTAKIADFGYSTLVNPHKLVIASTTPPWSDPTYDGTPVEFDSAKRLDSFSFGRLCLWVLYSLAFLQGNKAAVPSSMMPQSDDYSLKRANEVLKLIPGLQKSQKTELLHLFNDTLQPDIKLRSTNFRKFADALGADEITLQDSFPISLDENRMIAKPLFRVGQVHRPFTHSSVSISASN